MSDNAVRSVRAVLLQAFNTETTKNHGAARSGSDDKSPQAVLQQPRMKIEPQAEAQAAHAEVGQDPWGASCAGRIFATALISMISCWCIRMSARKPSSNWTPL